MFNMQIPCIIQMHPITLKMHLIARICIQCSKLYLMIKDAIIYRNYTTTIILILSSANPSI